MSIRTARRGDGEVPAHTPADRCVQLALTMRREDSYFRWQIFQRECCNAAAEAFEALIIETNAGV